MAEQRHDQLYEPLLKGILLININTNNMTQNYLPEIDIRIEKQHKCIEAPFNHPSKYAKRKSMINQKYDWIKYSVLTPNAPINQFVRISLSNKTALFKRRSIPYHDDPQRQILAPLQGHQTKRIVVLKQSPRLSTEPYFSDLTACKSLLNAKPKERRAGLMELGRRLGPSGKKTLHHRSLMEIASVQGRSPESRKTEADQFSLCGWEDMSNGSQKEAKVGRIR